MAGNGQDNVIVFLISIFEDSTKVSLVIHFSVISYLGVEILSFYQKLLARGWSQPTRN